MTTMTMEALWYKAYGDPDQFWWEQYLKAVKKFGGENHVNWGSIVSVPSHHDHSDLSFETWRDRSPLL
jgi:hypothetical protein